VNKIVVGMADMATSAREDDAIITYSLGSCLGVSCYDPVAKVGGIIHCMLPLSRMDSEKAAVKPAMFVDTGVPLFLQRIFELGARKSRLVVKVAGGAKVLEQADHFKIGERNYTVLRKVLWKNNILIASEAIGGMRPRTMCLYMATGTTTVRTGGEKVEEL